MSTSSSGTTSERRDDGGPAYPVQDMIEEGKIVCHRGMSLRTHLVANVLPAIIVKIPCLADRDALGVVPPANLVSPEVGLVIRRAAVNLAFEYADMVIARLAAEKAGGAS